MKIRRIYSILFLFIIQLTFDGVFAQPAPAEDENIPYLVTFGKNSDPSWGDDDFCQIFFFVIPKNRMEPVYIRIYDPDTGGNIDEQKGDYNTRIKFSVYGGNQCWSNIDAQATNPIGNYKSGVELDSRIFGSDAKYDKKWFAFGPFNPFEGELVEQFGGRVLKVVAEGVSGDDGNLYRYFLSESATENKRIEGGNLFTYEYSFRLSDDKNHVSQIYPYVDDKTISVKVSNFDWDDDGQIKVISVAKNGLLCDVSGEGDWKKQEFTVVEKEKNTSLEIQFIKSPTKNIENNNVCVVVQNQYGHSLPFYVIPIGGVPVYHPKIIMRAIEK